MRIHSARWRWVIVGFLLLLAGLSLGPATLRAASGAVFSGQATVVRATLPLITQPMFFEVHRLSVFTPRALDVDVVLDLMIPDLDIVLAFVHSPVKEIRAVGLPILSDKVDIANVRVEFESGCVANFTASRVSTERVRKLRLFQPQEYISLDYGKQLAVKFHVDADRQISFAELACSRRLNVLPGPCS